VGNGLSAHRILVMIERKEIHLDLHRKPVGKEKHFAQPTRGIRLLIVVTSQEYS
jgi:hypothetical protein